jgi:large subunit ribosomal protein L30
MLKITLLRSYEGLNERMRDTLRALGLRKRHMAVLKKENPAIDGMIRKVSHLVKVETVEAA